jgi:hypothetical protein
MESREHIFAYGGAYILTFNSNKQVVIFTSGVEGYGLYEREKSEKITNYSDITMEVEDTKEKIYFKDIALTQLLDYMLQEVYDKYREGFEDCKYLDVARYPGHRTIYEH